MVSIKAFALRVGLVVCVSPLASCSNTPWAANLERSLAADPRLQTSPVLVGTSPSAAATPTRPETTSLPAGFPGEIPRYPTATLVAVAQPNTTTAPFTQTRWTTSDSVVQVQQFYRDKLKSGGWQTVQPSGGVNSSTAIAAIRDTLRVSIEFPEAGSGSPPDSPAESAEFTLNYQFDPSLTAAQSPTAETPNAGDPAFVGPVPPSGWATAPDAANQPVPASAYSDLDQAPQELRKYVSDLANLSALPLRSPGGSTLFKPNQAITRREYARWLVDANNKLYVNQASRQIRLGTASDQPAFPDISPSDPDFGAIQGLANAGLIASSLSGGSSPVNFRPDAALTREDLVLWKVPVDIRRSLPAANLDAVQQTWGFQDAAKIDPKAQRAVIADYQNGDLANIRRAFGYTTLFQPKKAVSRAEAAAALWYFGSQGDGLSAEDAAQAVKGG